MDNNKGKAKLKKTKMKRPLGNNIEQYIYSHGLTNPKFADQLNEYLQRQYPDFENTCTANSIWTYTSRKTGNYIGSVPKDPRVLEAIAGVIGKSLDELMCKYLSREDFVNSMPETVNKNVNDGITKIVEYENNVPPNFDPNAFFDLPDDVIEFAFNLLDEDVNEEDGQLLINLKVGIRADGRNGKVYVMYYFKDGYMTYSYNSNDYQTFLNIFDNDEIIMLHEIVEDDEYCALEEVGLFKDVLCFVASMADLPDYEEYAYLSGYYNVKFVLNIDEDAITLLQIIKDVNYVYGLKQSNSVEELNKYLGNDMMRQLIELHWVNLCIYVEKSVMTEYKTIIAEYIKKAKEIIAVIDKETYEEDIKEIAKLLTANRCG